MQDGPDHGTHIAPTKAHLHRWRSLAHQWWPPQIGHRPGTPQAGRLLCRLACLAPAGQEGERGPVAAAQLCQAAGRCLALVKEQMCCFPAEGRAPTHAHPAAAAAAGWGWVVVAWGWEVLGLEAACEV